MNLQSNEIIITDQDHVRLNALLEAFDGETFEWLEEELARANVVPQAEIPADVVTMNSVVTFVDESTKEESQVAIVYPPYADASEGRLSVLAPMGAALLGLRVGQEIECPLPNGKWRRIRVLAVSFQPEALGAFDL